MKKNKLILSHCPNFYKIKNFEFDESDYISIKILNIYEDYIFNIDEEDLSLINKVERLDRIVAKYVDDYNFRKEIQEGVLKIRVKRGTDVIETIINNLISLFENYEDGYTRNIYFARWI